MNTTLLQNTFLSPEEKYKRSRGYHGEFFVLPDFDDGWKQNLYDDILRYLENIWSWDIGIEIYENIESYKWALHVVLDLDKVTGENRDELMTLATTLQRDYHMTPIHQGVHYATPDKESLPVVLESPKDWEAGYHRHKLQWYVASIFVMQCEIDRISYLISTIGSGSDMGMPWFIWDLFKTRQSLTSQLKEMNHQVQELTAQLYLELSTESFWVDGYSISREKADIIIDINQNTWWSTTSNVLDRMESMMQEYKDQIDIGKSDMMGFVSQISDLLAQWGVIKKEKDYYGLISEVETEENTRDIISGINMGTGEKFYSLNGIIEWIKVHWVNEIHGMRQVNALANTILSCVIIQDENLNWRLFVLRNTEYIECYIDCINDYNTLESVYFDDCWDIVSGWMKEVEMVKWFYKSATGYTYLEIPWIENITSIRNCRHDTSGEMIWWELHDGDGWVSFWKVWWEYKYLKIHTSRVAWRDFSYDDAGDVVRGYFWDKVKLPFWKEDDLYTTLPLDHSYETKNARALRNLVFEDNILVYGEIEAMYDYREYAWVPFWKENEKYNLLKIKGKNVRQVNNPVFRDNKLLYGHCYINYWHSKPFWRHDDKYVWVPIKSDAIEAYERDVDGVVLSGRYKKKDEWYEFTKVWNLYVNTDKKVIGKWFKKLG